MNPIIKYIVKLLALIIFQVVVLKNLEFGTGNWWITPFIFTMIILELPVKFNPLTAMLVAGLLGFVIDGFYDTYGMHMSACIFIAFVRFYLIKLILPKDGFDTSSALTVANVGLTLYIVYVGILSLLYHLWFFILESFTFNSVLLRISQSIVSGLFATLIIILFHYVFSKSNKR